MLRIKHINGDSCFLLTFLPSYALADASESFPGAYTVLIDPWLTGPSKVWSARFALTEHTVAACIDNLNELPRPDLVLISQEKNDHCHQPTLTQLSSSGGSIIVGTTAAARKIKSWKHFKNSHIHALQRYEERKEDTVFRIPVYAVSDSTAPGEITIALLAPKADLTGLHNAMAITYRAPSSTLSPKKGHSHSSSAPTTRAGTPTLFKKMSSSLLRSLTPTASSLGSTYTLSGTTEPTISLIYSPHGVAYPFVSAYASSHLLSCNALPLTALIHCLDSIANPWYLGGTICSGAPSGAEIAKNLSARVWVGAHDEDKINSGLSLKSLKYLKYERDGIREMIGAKIVAGGDLQGVVMTTEESVTELLELLPGEEICVKPK
jgi:hypothetical protein